jgi:hypothetical protein
MPHLAQVFMSISVLPAYLEERAIFISERANGRYRCAGTWKVYDVTLALRAHPCSVLAYMAGHTLVEIPFVALLAMMASIICYWLINLNPTAAVRGR